MARVLYISYTGLSDPLGESQVLQYLMGLAHRHTLALITFEKPEQIAKPGVRERLERICADAGIDWTPLRYHRRPGVPATAYDIANGTRVAIAKARAIGADVVHARSYIPGLMALAVKKRTGARYLFDMRGFWADERVDGGIWRAGSPLYRLAKSVEKMLFLEADHVVSLTRAGVGELSQFPYLAGRVPPVSVIPTCTNLELFRPSGESVARAFTLGYVGSAGSWYLFAEVARAVRLLFARDPEARFLVVNRSEHADLRARLEAARVDLARVDIVGSAYHDVPAWMSRMTAGVFFIKPVFSKRASCPTKMGEFLGCGLPCLANGGVGDVADDLAQTGTGVTVAAFGEDELSAALERLIALARDPDIAHRCRRAAEERFSLARGIARYDAIYGMLVTSA